VDTEGLDVDTCAHQVILKLEAMGLVKGLIPPTSLKRRKGADGPL
jgi:hypothetical protein